MMASGYFPRLMLVLVAVALLDLVGCSRRPPIAADLMIEGVPHQLTLALTPQQKSRGLGGVEGIPVNGGMLFVYPSERQLWYFMRDCLVDIDVIFVDGAGKVVATHEMSVEAPREIGESEDAYAARLRQYPSRKPAKFAIELAAGSIGRLDIHVGDEVELPLDQLATWYREANSPTPSLLDRLFNRLSRYLPSS